MPTSSAVGRRAAGGAVDALLSAYRIGARVSWREMSSTAVRNGVDADTTARFAELVFAYIDELSAASVAGHNDELATTGRVRQRLLERVAGHLLDGSTPEVVEAAVARADWSPPQTLTAVIVPESQVRTVLNAIAGETLQSTEDARRTGRCCWSLTPTGVVAEPCSGPWRGGARWRGRPARGCRCGPPTTGPCGCTPSGSAPTARSTSPSWCSRADRSALEDLRTRALAPLEQLRSSSADKLTETLRSWLLHHGRRDAVAAELFVHPQTVRYRMGQLREAFGDRLEDPRSVLELTLALGLPGRGAAQSAE